MPSRPLQPDAGFLRALRRELLDRHGPQGWWWPGESPFEIALGAVLVQRTRWTNAAQALRALIAAGLGSPAALAAADEDRVRELIRCAGLPGAKPHRVRCLAAWWDERAEAAAQLPDAVLRAELLRVDGIGEETADAIALYSFRRPAFLCDAYARRVLSARGVQVPSSYRAFARVLAPGIAEAGFGVAELAELHGLIVEEGKRLASSGSGESASG